MSATFLPVPEENEQLRAKLAEMVALLEQQNAALISLTQEQDGLAAERDHFKAAYEEAEADRQRRVFRRNDGFR
jgi:hypothetical protein